MPCSFPPSSRSSSGGDGEEEKVSGGQQQPEEEASPFSSSPPSVILRLKAYPNVSLHTDDARRSAVITFLPATIPTLADAATIQQQPPDVSLPAATPSKEDTDGEEEGGAPPSDAVTAEVFPCLLLRERELAQFLLYLQEILQEIRALPLPPD